MEIVQLFNHVHPFHQRDGGFYEGVPGAGRDLDEVRVGGGVSKSKEKLYSY